MPVTAARRSQQSAFEESLDAIFAQSLSRAPGDWLRDVRKEAFDKFKKAGVPHKKLEWWKYTDLAAALSVPLSLPTPVQKVSLTKSSWIADAPGYEVEITNGEVTKFPKSGLQDGVEIIPLREALSVPSLWLRPWLLPSTSTISNLNLAFCSDGILVRIGAGVKANLPIFLRSIENVAGAMTHTRNVVVLEEEAEADLIEFNESMVSGPTLSTCRTVFVLAAGAKLAHASLNKFTDGNVAVREAQFDIEEKANCSSAQFNVGNGLVRNDIQANLDGESAIYNFSGAYTADRGQVSDYSLTVNHNAPETTSRILAKGVARAGGRGVVQGRVRVAQNAQRTDSHQLARGILLEEGAEIFHRPELEIYADDVKCGHGATMGGLDESQLFYLVSRGIPEVEAKSMLMSAYFGEVLQNAPAAIRAGLQSTFDQWLQPKVAQP